MPRKTKTDKPRSSSIKFSVDEETKQDLIAQADAAGVSLSSYIYDCLVKRRSTSARHSVILISKLDQLLAQQLEIAQAIDAASDDLDCTVCLARLERLEQMFTSLLPDYDPRTAVAREDSPL